MEGMVEVLLQEVVEEEPGSPRYEVLHELLRAKSSTSSIAPPEQGPFSDEEYALVLQVRSSSSRRSSSSVVGGSSSSSGGGGGGGNSLIDKRVVLS